MKNKTIKEAIQSTADLDIRDFHGLPPRSTQVTMSSLVDHPPHYNAGKYETIDVIEDWELDFNCGNAVKYISRHMHKGCPVRDIEKAIWYLERRLQTLKGSQQ